MTLYPASIGCVIITLVAISTGYAAESDQAFLTCPTFSDDQVRLAMTAMHLGKIVYSL